jgi:arginine decarboxylase
MPASLVSDFPVLIIAARAEDDSAIARSVVEIIGELDGRTLAVQIVPYPPGIPILMPGERFGKDTRAVGDYLLGLEEFDRRFAGFEHDTHGVEVRTDKNGRRHYVLYCLTS